MNNHDTCPQRQSATTLAFPAYIFLVNANSATVHGVPDDERDPKSPGSAVE